MLFEAFALFESQIYYTYKIVQSKLCTSRMLKSSWWRGYSNMVVGRRKQLTKAGASELTFGDNNWKAGESLAIP